jgi:hypothetical protein
MSSVVFGASAAEAGTTFVPNDPHLHLLRRATWGPTPATLAEAKRFGASRWLERQLKPGSIDDHKCDVMIASAFPRLSWSIAQAAGSLDFGWNLMFDLGVATLARAA